MLNPTLSKEGRPRSLHMRRSVSLLLAGALTVVLPACGSGSSSADGYRIVQVPTSISEFTVTIREAAEEYAKDAGVEYQFQLPGSPDVAGQTATFNAVVASRPDAILLEPIDTAAMMGPVEAAKKLGIKIITYDSNLDDESLPDSFISNDYVASGRHLAEQLLQLTDGEGEYLHLAALPGLGFTQKLIQGWEEVLDDQSSVTQLAIDYTQGEPSKAAAIVSAALSAHPDLAGAYIGTLPEQNGALNALRRAQAVGEVKTVAWDATPEGVENLEAGNFDVIISTRAGELGERLIQTAIDVLDGEDVPAFQPMTDCIITRENLDDPANKPCLYLPVE